jgi:hypothetical protein
VRVHVRDIRQWSCWTWKWREHRLLWCSNKITAMHEHFSLSFASFLFIIIIRDFHLFCVSALPHTFSVSDSDLMSQAGFWDERVSWESSLDMSLEFLQKWQSLTSYETFRLQLELCFRQMCPPLAFYSQRISIARLYSCPRKRMRRE